MPRLITFEINSHNCELSESLQWLTKSGYFQVTRLRGVLSLQTHRVGPLPIINHYLDRTLLVRLLDRHVPTTDRRATLSHASALAVLIRSLLVEREPIYRQQEIVATFAPELFGLLPQHIARLSDDRIGKALDALYDADRGLLMTDVVLAVGKRFNVTFDEQHNDSTTIKFCGQYRAANGRSIRGKRAPRITFGHSKDHRPDLKQLLFIMTTSADGAIPTQFRCAHGHTSDGTTHIDTWEALKQIYGKPNFLYVADSKLCTRENMDYIHYRDGRFITVLPRTRSEDADFRRWIQSNEPTWEKVWDRPNPQRKYGPRDRWFVFQPQLPSREGWPLTWVYSTLLGLRQEQTRNERIAAAVHQLETIKAKLHGPKARIKHVNELEKRVTKVLKNNQVSCYLKVQYPTRAIHHFRQRTPGRPGKKTTYTRITETRLDLVWDIDAAAVDYDRKSDGMYPLLSNDRSLTAKQILQAHKRQPKIEKRFSHIKSVHHLAPVFLKNEGRIEAFFFVYFLALTLHALIERDIRNAMAREGIVEIPLYPEERPCKQPTTEHILRLFSLLERHTLTQDGNVIQVFSPTLTDLQKEVLRLLHLSPACCK